MSPRNPARRPRRTTVIVVASVALIAFGVFQWLIWNPRQEVPARADAILVLAYGNDRQELGRDLAARGVSENLVVSHSVKVRRFLDPTDELKPKDGEWVEECDRDYPHYRSYCIEPDPNTTGGEVAAFRQLADEKGWASVVLVTERSHLARAEMLLNRCFSGQIYPVASHPDGGIFRAIQRSFYEFGAYLKDVVLPPSC